MLREEGVLLLVSRCFGTALTDADDRLAADVNAGSCRVAGALRRMVRAACPYLYHLFPRRVLVD